MGDAETLRLMSLDVENVLRLKAVSLKMGKDDVLIIEGGNEQGKSSVLMALESLLAGKNAKALREPLHGDAKKGQIVARFGGLVVTKKFKSGKSPTLSITADKGKKMGKPQTILTELFNHIALDPLKFIGQSAKEQRDTLSALMGFDSSKFDERYATAFEDRKNAKREAKRLTSAMCETPFEDGAPATLVDVAELMDEAKGRREHNEEIDSALRSCQGLRNDVQEFDRQLECAAHDIDELAKQLADAKIERDVRAAERDKTAGELATQETALQKMEQMDLAVIEDKIAAADQLNALFRGNERHNDLRSQATTAEGELERLNEELEKIKSEKDSARLAARERLPVQDLDITEDAVTYKGTPLSQAGGSAQLRVSTAVAIALNKDKRVKLLLLDDAEKLDPDSTKAVLEMAKDAGFQVILARVGDGKEATVLIEDGTVKEVNGA